MPTILFYFFLVPTCSTYAQEAVPHSYLSLGTGLMRAISRDEAIAAYKLKGSNIYLQAAYARQKRRMESAFDFTIASIHQKSAFQNTPSVPAQFYFLQYGLQREFLMTKKLRLWTGPGISLRAVSRETGNTKTGEAIASLDGRVKMVYKFSNARKLEGALGLPLFSQLVYRGYALSDLVTGITGWGSLQSFQIRLAYLIPLGDRLEFVLGYDTWFLHYLVREPVWILNQQYFGSLRINLMRNAETRQ